MKEVKFTRDELIQLLKLATNFEKYLKTVPEREMALAAASTISKKIIDLLQEAE